MKRIVVNTADILYNIENIREICGNKRIIAVIKGNGYGLGLIPFAKLLTENGIDFLAVSDICDAVTLRENGIECEILLLSSTSIPNEAQLIAKHGITATVGSITAATTLNETGIKCKAHIKVETGFGRFGFENADEVQILENVEYTGVYSHFSDSFGKDEKHTKIQFDRFLPFVKALNDRGINPELKHIANSCATVRFNYSHLDAVRVGSALVGRLSVENNLKPIGVFENEISEIKILPKGHNVGYANTFITKKETKIAVVGGGYADGLFVKKDKDLTRFMDILRYIYGDIKLLGKKISVSVNGKSVNVIGRVGMCNLILDITDTDIKLGDTVRIKCNPFMVDSTIPRIFI